MTQVIDGRDNPDAISAAREKMRAQGNPKQEIFCVLWDHGADLPKNPRWYENQKQAERALVATMSNKDDLVAHYPEDFSLVQIGNYNSTTGEITSVPHKTIITGSKAKMLSDQKLKGE